MPTVVMQARIIPKQVEGTIFALFMSLNNLSGQFIAPLFGATLADHFGVSSEDFRMFPLLIMI